MYEARQNKEKVSRRIIQKVKNKGTKHCMLFPLQMFKCWKVDGFPEQKNNRTELKIIPEKANTPIYTVNVSNRHNIDNYFIAYDQNAYDSKDLNTIVLSSYNFYEGISDFAEAIKNELNRSKIKNGSYNAQTIGRTYPKTDNLNPSFESDRAGTNVHSYPIGNGGSAITLTKSEHISLKVILRGIFADKGESSYTIAKNEWLRNFTNDNLHKIIIDTLHLDWKVKDFHNNE